MEGNKRLNKISNNLFKSPKVTSGAQKLRTGDGGLLDAKGCSFFPMTVPQDCFSWKNLIGVPAGLYDVTSPFCPAKQESDFEIDDFVSLLQVLFTPHGNNDLRPRPI